MSTEGQIPSGCAGNGKVLAGILLGKTPEITRSASAGTAGRNWDRLGDHRPWHSPGSSEVGGERMARGLVSGWDPAQPGDMGQKKPFAPARVRAAAAGAEHPSSPSPAGGCESSQARPGRHEESSRC